MINFIRRRDLLARSIRAHGLDALVVAKTCNVSYLTGFTGDSSFLLVTPERSILVSDDRYRVQISAECPGLEAHFRGHDRNTYQAVGDVVSKMGLIGVAVEAAGVTLQEFEFLKDQCKGATLTGKSDLVESQRAIKDETEIQLIRESIRIAERAFTAMRATMRATDTEKDLGDMLDAFIRRAGGTSLAFPAIVGVGDRSALPHCPLSSRRADSAELLLVDWGALANQYHSDLTRIIWSPARRFDLDVESRLQKMYTVVHEAQRRAIAAIRPGVSVKVVDAAARGYIAEAGYGEYFNHGLGHGIGLEIHEAPSIRSNSDDILAAGMVVTIEPGVYLPEFAGVRIEDDILVTADGPEILTSVGRNWDSL
jgi:Xaa-Pro aminopeptidase